MFSNLNFIFNYLDFNDIIKKNGDDNMRLSQIPTDKIFTDEEIGQIVYSNTSDTGLSTEYGLVFGNSMLIKERVKAAIKAYKDGRIKKIIFSGGSNGISNQSNDTVPEAVKMKNLAIQMGMKEEDILIEDKSKNSFENVDNTFSMIPERNAITVITSEFHLKRCFAIIKKRFPNMEVVLIPAKDGFSDKENWFLSDNSWNSGRSLVTYEANLLIQYAKENKIADLEVPDEILPLKTK